jgi:hypothetical protein
MYAWDKELTKDGNLWATLLLKTVFRVLEQRWAEGGDNAKLPEVLYVQCDNAGDNKNAKMFGMGELLVRLGIFRKVKFSFLPVGHTHEDIDACFGAGSCQLGRQNAFTVSQAGDVWKRAWPSTKGFDYVGVGCTWPRI